MGITMHRIISPIFGLMMLLGILCLVAACDRGLGDLSRETAKDLIFEFGKKPDDGFITRPALWDGAFSAGVDQGYWLENTGLSPKGIEFFSSVSKEFITPKGQVEPKIEVTGIADALEGLKEAQFKVSYSDISGVAKRFVARGASGVAIFRKFDDGWRIEDVKVDWERAAVPLTDVELTAASVDQAAGARAAAEEQAASEQRFQASRADLGEVQVFTCARPGNGYREPVITTYRLSRVNLEISIDYSGQNTETEAFWFGAIKNFASNNAELYLEGYGMGSTRVVMSFQCEGYASKSQAILDKYNAWMAEYSDVVQKLHP